MAKLKKPTLGVIVGSRGFFPKHLASSGRKTILELLEKEGINAVCLTPEDSPNGAVESLNDAQKCADLFKAHRDDIDGILLTLPNFGEERPIANTVRWAGLNVPVLVHAFPDTADRMTIKDRRDSFCGKMSACNNLSQYGVKYSLTALHTVDPNSQSFKRDLRNFVSTCQVVKGLRGARVGALGARPAAFSTVRYSEKLLEMSGISVETLDLSEAFGRIHRLQDSEPAVKEQIEMLHAYANIGPNVPPEATAAAKPPRATI